MLLASVAVTGASVIAVTPVAQNLPAIEAAVQQRAVELVAFENPFAVLGSTFGKAFQNLSNRGGELSATLVPNLSAILGNPELQREISVILFRPETVAQQLQDRLAEHQETLRLGWEQSQAGWAAHNELLPGMLERANAELAAGNFTEAFAHVNDWFIFGLGAAGWPLYPSLAVPGQVARDVGAPAIAAILDSFLGSDTSIVGIPHAIMVPFVSAIFRFTDSLDEIRIAAEAGDVVTAISHTVNLPAKVLGAFLNGYSPSIAEDWNVFPGLLTPGGPIDTFFVQYPTMIANALKALTGQTATTNSVEALSKVSSSAVASEDDTITLDVETGGGSATPVETVSSSTDATEEEAPAEEATEETAPVAEETTEETTEETAPVAEETTPVSEETAPVSEESGTESDAKGDTTSDEKADSKADAKDDKADAKADKADKADAKADKSDAKADNADAKADKSDGKADKADAKADKSDAKADKADKSDAKSSSSGSSSSGSSSSGGSSSSE